MSVSTELEMVFSDSDGLSLNEEGFTCKNVPH